jgi:hypothetical protein
VNDDNEDGSQKKIGGKSNEVVIQRSNGTATLIKGDEKQKPIAT